MSGLEAAFLRRFRQMSPRAQTAVSAAIERCADGQPCREAMIEALVELGDAPDVARAKVDECFVHPVG